ncbi:MAG: hypothetical protein IIV47_04990 [Clostridia bacterium]|nr:hypothetical protein [Clostridia bacterium]
MALIEKLNAIGNAIREKNGTIDLISLAEMPQAILDIKGDCDISDDSDMMPPHYSGASYTDITYNEDNTITLTEKDGTEHTMVCTYENDMLVSVTYDGKAIKLGYEGEELKSIGKTAVDLSGYFKESETVVLDLTANFALLEDGGVFENAYVATVPIENNPFENGQFYTLTIDNTKSYRLTYVSYDAGSEGIISYIFGEDDSKFFGFVQDGMFMMTSVYELKGEHKITIATRSNEPSYFMCINYIEDHFDGTTTYYISEFFLRTNDFAEGESTVRIYDEDGVEYYNSKINFESDGNELPYKAYGSLALKDDYALYNTAKNGKAITVEISQTIDGNTIEKTYGGVPYEFMWDEPDEVEKYAYAWGNDFKYMDEMRGS